MAESFGVEGRGKFYEEAGAIRDVVQNHMLQVVAFLAMEPPTMMYVDSVRDEQVKIFRTIPPLSPANIVRGQFRGYRDEPGVSPHSDVETFAALRLEVDSWRWAGVPFLIRAGKRLPTTATEVFVKLRKPPLAKMGADGRNYFRFRLGPDIELSLGGRVKRPGPLMVPMPVELSAVKYTTSDEMDAYERLLTDAMKGDQLLFVRQDAVEAAWAMWIPFSAIAVRPMYTSRVPGVRRTRASWPPISAVGTIRNKDIVKSSVASRYRLCGGSWGGPQHAIDPRDGKTHHVEVATLDAFHPTRSHALDGVGSGFVHGLAAGDVGSDLLLREWAEDDLRDLGFRELKARRQQAHSRDDLVSPPGQQAQHARSVRLVGWLLQQVFVNHYNGISAEDRALRMASQNGTGFVARQPLRVVERRFIWSGLLRDVRGLDCERDVGVTQQLGAAW